MSKTAKTAIGGMLVALSVVLLIPTALEIFVYALPAFAGVITMFCVIEMGKSWAFGVYAATAIIGMLVLPNKEAAVLYAECYITRTRRTWSMRRMLSAVASSMGLPRSTMV